MTEVLELGYLLDGVSESTEKQDKYGLKMKKLNICQSITRDNWKNKYLWRRKRNEDVNASADPTVEGEEDTEKIKQYQTELRRVPHSGKHTPTGT